MIITATGMRTDMERAVQMPMIPSTSFPPISREDLVDLGSSPQKLVGGATPTGKRKKCRMTLEVLLTLEFALLQFPINLELITVCKSTSDFPKLNIVLMSISVSFTSLSDSSPETKASSTSKLWVQIFKGLKKVSGLSINLCKLPIFVLP